MAIKAGDLVRSYDFKHIRNCYVEGVVVGVYPEGRRDIGLSHPCYRIHVARRVWDGDSCPANGPDDYVYPPINGTRTWMDEVCNGVELLNAEDAESLRRMSIVEYFNSLED